MKCGLGAWVNLALFEVVLITKAARLYFRNLKNWDSSHAISGENTPDLADIWAILGLSKN